jgi:hypothetical protein
MCVSKVGFEQVGAAQVAIEDGAAEIGAA